MIATLTLSGPSLVLSWVLFLGVGCALTVGLIYGSELVAEWFENRRKPGAPL